MTGKIDTLSEQINLCPGKDRKALRRQLKKALGEKGARRESLLQQCQLKITQLIQIRSEKASQSLKTEFHPDLPISARVQDISSAIKMNPVTVVCGETGSGKSTQLPKICLQLGYGLDGIIGHTQPRRIAARTIASRLADETATKAGQQVACKIRHHDQSSDKTWIKVMTDGVLLAEMQRDRWLSEYEVIIIDEAHERSLNIDFLLGYIKLLLDKRSDLKIIITSATIDVERFSSYFNDAPVIEVSGRSFPVDIRYQAIDEEDVEDEVARGNALLSAINSLGKESMGDILVFLDGEREIRDMQLFLQKQHIPDTDCLPLYGRLAQRQQAKIFQPHKRRHIILATNVAETSLTIDGIKYVIDFGYARISRYSYRSKVQRLPIEKISRASANQRAGRCGRTSEGVCIRLYSEEDFVQRPEFTEPEIARTNLAAVILQMKALHLGDIHQFDFIEPPNRRFINDGIRLLNELGALDANQSLTKTGRMMARLPVDPRLARMLLAGRHWNCLNEILIICSALSIQDARERPLEQQEKADAAHAKFQHERSDFMWFLNFWKFYQEQSQKLSRNKLQKLCRQNYVSAVRMLEWQDIHEQLNNICREQKMKINSVQADYNNIHCAVLTGLSSHVAMKDEAYEYLGARNVRVKLFPGSGLFKSSPKWVMAYELVETRQLYARTVAQIDPAWLLKTASHLIQREYLQPAWSIDKQQVLVREKITLYGLIIVAGKDVSYARVDALDCRKRFIQEALVEQQLNSKAGWYQHNQEIIEQIKQLEIKRRRLDLFNEEALYNFYDNLLPNEVLSPETLDNWRRKAEKKDKRCLFIQTETITTVDKLDEADINYPDQLQVNSVDLPLNYVFSPGKREDGVSVEVPMFLLNQLSESHFDRLVPGLLNEKIICLLKSLPKSLRKQLVPIPETAVECMQALQTQTGPLLTCMSDFLFRHHGIQVSESDWNCEVLPEHLQINIKVIDEKGECVDHDHDLKILKSRLKVEATEFFSSVQTGETEQSGITDWTFGELPESIKVEINQLEVAAYPAIQDDIDSVSIVYLDTQSTADRETVRGLRRLCMLRLAKEVKYLAKNMPELVKIKLLFSSVGDSQALEQDLIALAFDRVFVHDKMLPRNSDEFEARLKEGAKVLVDQANDLSLLVFRILTLRSEIYDEIEKLKNEIHDLVYDDLCEQLNSLIYDGFLLYTSVEWLQQYPRYLTAIQKRLHKPGFAGSREQTEIKRLQQYEKQYYELNENSSTVSACADDLDYLFWMLQEYRVSLFAQELKTVMPVSCKRIENQFAIITGSATI